LGEDYCLLAVGRGNSDEYVNLAKEKGVLQNCCFIESINNQELARYYSLADCMCTPSRWEGFGIVFVEALACEAVVVSSDIAPMNEYIEHMKNGLLVKEYEDPAVLAEMIKLACNDKQIRGYIKENARDSVKNFSKDKIDELEIEYYKKVLDLRECGDTTYGKYSFKRIQRKIERIGNNIKSKYSNNSGSELIKAVGWIKDNTVKEKGIIVSSDQKISYPEVTGYMIPTLYKTGERELAKQYAAWLMEQQNDDGSFSAADGIPYPFDTGQVMRGFLTVLDDMPEIEEPLKRACSYIINNMAVNGRIKSFYDDKITEYVHLYVLPPLFESGKRLQENSFIEAAQRSLEYYKSQPDLIEFNVISHFYGYIMEALVDMGETELAKKGMEVITKLQNKNGLIPAYKDVDWICVPGQAQLAIVYYKLGLKKQGDMALDYLKKKQRSGGGFFGSLGKGAKYFYKKEISWAVKFFIDAYYLKIESFFDTTFNGIAPVELEENDARIQEILGFVDNLDGKKVLDTGCGKGRFAKILKDKYPNAEIYGVDISEELLKSVPENIITMQGSIMDMKFSDNFFDVVYCVETLEHAPETENALRELLRVVRKNGKIIIIDKNKRKLGYFPIQPWEKWFFKEDVEDKLRSLGFQVTSNYIPFHASSIPDDLFISWKCIKI
jgi:malonyl-CoA O-methyltransferase